MSRDLPTTPNLEHLRKQAKHRLAEMQQHDLSAQLADAQHAIAREYGFASWPKLKAYLESLPVPVPPRAMPASPLAGTWIANVPRSRQHPANPFQSAVLHVDVAGDTVTITNVVIDETGKEERGENTIRADGLERTSAGGYSLAVSWRGPRVLETLGKKDGVVIGRGTYEVDADGQTMTISNDEQRIVLDRMS